MWALTFSRDGKGTRRLAMGESEFVELCRDYTGMGFVLVSVEVVP